MKKNLLLIASAIILCLTSCSEVECDHSGEDKGNFEKTIVGNWYEETMNEEIHYSENGTLYDRSSRWERCEEIEGRYEYDKKNNKLTYRWTFLGQNQQSDYSVKKIEEFNIIIYSDIKGTFSLEKIVEDYNLRVGETVSIKFASERLDYKVLSYSSNNERIASVGSDGIVKAEGEKGITYIKLTTDKGNVRVKVTVGDNCADLWHDYVSLIGMDYNTVHKTLSSLGEPYTQGDEYALGYIHTFHDVIEISKIFLCPEERTVNEIQLLLKEAVTEAPILAYMDSHYYKLSEDKDVVYYSTVADEEASKAIIAYKKAEKIVYICETQHFFHPHVNDLWYDFTTTFGKGKEDVKTIMADLGYPFIMSDYNYSVDGSEYYSIKDNEYASMVGLVFNPEKQVSEFWVYLHVTSDPYEINSYLSNKYIHHEEEDTEYNLVFYNKEKDMRVVFDLYNFAVVYTNLSMIQHEPNNSIFGNYYEALGLTHDQIIDKFGTPFSDDTSLAYAIVSKYVSLLIMNFDTDTNKCNVVSYRINEDINKEEIISYLNSEYTVFEKGTEPDGSVYAWTNEKTLEESNVGILYYPEKRLVQFVPIGTSAKAKSLGFSNLSSTNVNSKIESILAKRGKNAMSLKNSIN